MIIATQFAYIICIGLLALTEKNFPLLSLKFIYLAIIKHEGNGNPLQYSCLENSMDRGSWQARIHRVTTVGQDLAAKPPPLCKT